MPHQTGLTLLEVLITLCLFSTLMLGLLVDNVVRQKYHRTVLEQTSSFLQLENTHEYPTP